MTVRDPKTNLRSSLLSLLLTSSLVGGAVACSFSEVPSVTQVPPTLSAQAPETPEAPPDSISFYYDGVKTSITIKDAAVLFAACTLNTGDSTKIVNFVNNTLKAGPITAAEVTGLGDPLKPAISDFTADGVVNCNDAAVLFAAVTVGTDAAKVNQFVSGTLKVSGVNVTQTQLDSFFPKSTPTPSPTATPTVTPSPTATPTPTPSPAIVVVPSSLTINALSSAKLEISPSVAPTGGNLVLSVVSNDSTIASISGSSTLTFPSGSTSPQQVTVVGVSQGSANIVVSVAGASAATNYKGVLPVTVPVKVEPALPAGIKVTPDSVSTQVGSTVTFSLEPTQPPQNGSFVVAVSSSNPTVATVNLPTVTFAEGNTAPQTVAVTGVGTGTATITLTRASTTTATNYPATVAPQTVKVTVTVGPPVAAKTVYVAPGAGGDGSSLLSPAKFATGLQAAKTLQQSTPNLPVFLKVVGAGGENLALNEIAPVNGGTITIVPEPNFAGGVAGIQLGAKLTIKPGVTVSDIAIDLNNQDLIILGQGDKLKITALGGGAQEDVTIDAGATVTDSLITFKDNGNQLTVRGTLSNSTVEADVVLIDQPVKLAGSGTLQKVTVECKIGAGGPTQICVNVTGGSPQITDSQILVDLAGADTIFVNTDNNNPPNLTIQGSLIKQVPNNVALKAILVQHNDGALVIQGSTLDLNVNTDVNSRALRSTAASGSITLVGNIFKGYNFGGQPVVQILGNIGAFPQQITNNQFVITNAATIGIRLPANASPTLVDQYALNSGNTFGNANVKVIK
ncbi:hypothetical protein NW863_11805 [Synechococcus sp. B60.1]|uniref:hypothetical protein n=1 Tax=Synechococcus sp. B60.1 TaxID=2964522 RepID=UPI0039C2EE3B